MEHYSSAEALLWNGNGVVKKKSLIVAAVKWSLKISMWLLFVFWVALIFIHPSSFGDSFFNSLVKATRGTIFGPSGGTFLLMSAPVLAIALLSVPYLIICGNHDETNFLVRRSSKKASISLWTFPLLVEGVFGVVSAAEFIGIFLFYFYLVWAVCTSTLRNLSLVASLDLSPQEQRITMLENEGFSIGETGLFYLVFLFLPIARGSILLRLIDIPFEQATRYHIWLGHLMLFLFLVHGTCCLTAWTLDGTLLYQIFDWKEAGIQNFAGVMALLTGLVIWVTSLGFVRKWSFELFYYTHHLYVVFIALFALHVGDYRFSIAAAGIFLFVLDRFLRFCQSRKTVDVISATSFSCGAVELVLSKPKNLSYNALSFIFIQIRDISRLQWHPFSVSSSPLDGKYHLSILIKSLGNWTQKLSQATNDEKQEHNLKLKASVEGPYGHQVPYHLKYENLILIAGGIGISPFLAILSDILHRIDEDKPCLPRNVILLWAVRTSDEIRLLSAISFDSFSPSCFLKLDLSIHIYVTRQQNPNLEEGAGGCKIMNNPTRNRSNGISVLVGSGDTMWNGTYVIVSIIGLAISLALSGQLYLNPYHISSVAYRGVVELGCLVAAVLLFGGCVIGFWHFWETEIPGNQESSDHENETVQNLCESNLPNSSHTVIEYGSRPGIKEILGNVSKQWGNVDVGVIVCGPASLESSVAREIRAHNFRRETNYPVFHFHSHSFQL